MIYQQIELPQITNKDIEHAIQKVESSALETQLGFEQEMLPFYYLELHPELINMKNSPIRDTPPPEEYAYVMYSFGCISRQNKVRKWLFSQKQLLQQAVLVIVIVNTVAFCLFNYKIRVGESPDNRVSMYLEMGCNLFFGIEILIQCICYGVVMGKNTYLRNLWSCLNIMTFICTWSIFFDQSLTFVQITRTIRLLRLLRLLQEVHYLRNTIESFFQSFFKIYTVLIPLLIVIFGFAVVGLHFLSGVTGQRCQQNGIVDLNIQNLCGYWECPDGYECVDSFNKDDLKYLSFNYGFNNFDTIYESMLAVFLFLNATGWSGTTFMFWKAAPQELAAVYFISMLFVLYYLFSNLVLASLYESFIISSVIKTAKPTERGRSPKPQARRRTIQDTSGLKKASLYFHKLNVITQISQSSGQRLNTTVMPIDNNSLQPQVIDPKKSILKIIDKCVILTTSIILCLDTYDMSETEADNLFYADLVMNVALIIITSLKMLQLRKFMRKVSNIFDLILSVALCCVIILEASSVDHEVFIIIKSAKIIRILELIYSLVWLGSISILLRCLLATLLCIKHLIFLWLILALVLTIIGLEFFSDYLVLNNDIAIYYNGLGNSLMAVMNIFYNEEWHISMYQHALFREQSAFLFYIVSIWLGQILFMRLLQALFLNEFGKNLNQVEHQLPQIGILQQLTLLFDKFKRIFVKPVVLRTTSEDDSNAPLQEELSLKQKSEQAGCPDSFYKTLVEHKLYRMFILVMIAISSIKAAIQNPLIDPHSQTKLVIDVVFYFVTAMFAIEIILYILAYGLIGYVKQSLWSLLSIVIVIVNIIAIGYGNQSNFLLSLFDSLRILAFLKLGADQYKQLQVAIQAFQNAFVKMIQLSVFCFMILLICAVFALHLLKGNYFYCSLTDEHIQTKTDCFDYGGNWINQIFSFDNIWESINILFVVTTTEAWLPLMQIAWSSRGKDLQPMPNYDRTWALYFQTFFFIGNTLMLGMFITLITETYFKTRDEAQNLHLLNDKQREWFQIKKQIIKLKPIVTILPPENSMRKYAFTFIRRYEIPFLINIGLNVIILSLFYARMNTEYRTSLENFNIAFIVIQFIEILLRVTAKAQKQYFIELAAITYCFIVWFIPLRALQTVSVAIQIIRSYRIVKHSKSMNKLFNSIFAVLPNALSMLLMMFIVLFIYTIVGMDLFAYLRPQPTLNGYDMDFRQFFGAMTALVRVASAEQWWILLIETANVQGPGFACIYIDEYEEFLEYGFNGCGSKLAYPYFISFHLIFSLMILNLFVASILGAYDEFTKSEESAISKYQLLDVIELWHKYDPEGQGYINYKLFWRLSSEIAIIFGVEQSDLLDINNKKHFLQALKIPIYESVDSNVFCYKFHDVIISLTKISVTVKYGVTNLEPEDQMIFQKVYGEQMEGQFDRKLRSTVFNSGDMASIIYIQQKFREWKNKTLLKNRTVINALGDLRSFIKPKAKTLAEQISDQNENIV